MAKQSLYSEKSATSDSNVFRPTNKPPVSNPYTVSSTAEERAIISIPDQPWEKTPYNRTINDRLSSNEGPEQLTNPITNQTFVIYSAARSDNRDYCLGQLELVGDDPMSPSSWLKHDDYCVFYQNPDEEAYGVGHASFTVSPDGTENWIVYHGKTSSRVCLCQQAVSSVTQTHTLAWIRLLFFLIQVLDANAI